MKQIGLGAILSRLRSLGAIGGTLILETGTAPEHHDRAGKFFKELRWMASHFTGQLIRDALDTYAEQMKIDLKDNPFAEEVKGCDSPEAILQLLEKNRDEFKEYRDKNRKFIDCLNPVVKFVHAFSEVLGEATSLVSAERLRSTISLLLTLSPP
jgi:hypothetical protein